MSSFLSGKVYEWMKWLAIIVIPALGVAYQALSGVWGLPYGNEVSQTTQIITALLGAVLGISTIQYNKSASSTDMENITEKAKTEGK